MKHPIDKINMSRISKAKSTRSTRSTLLLCTRCSGSGRYIVTFMRSYGIEYISDYRPCKMCNGSGRTM